MSLADNKVRVKLVFMGVDSMPASPDVLGGNVCRDLAKLTKFVYFGKNLGKNIPPDSSIVRINFISGFNSSFSQIIFETIFGPSSNSMIATL